MLNFPELEDKVLAKWREQDIFHLSLNKPAPRGNFVFFEGPPTANGRPGVHHVLARAFKDVLPRFKTMQGYHVERKAGWDTHGLPVEIQVEKELGISGKPQIESYGIKEFNEKCRQSVWQFKDDWEKLTERIGFWLDLDQPYITYEKNYIETLWWIFQQIAKQDLLYLGYKVVPHCPRCGTALSSHEVAQGYKAVTETSVFLKFKLQTGQKVGDFALPDNSYILSWTTTPWTLPGNVALAVGPEMVYSLVRLPSKEVVILAKVLLNTVLDQFEELAEVKGEDLVGLVYEPLFASAIPEDVTNFANAFKVYPADFVTTTDGTGVVHTAVMYGLEDYELGEAVGLPKFHTVDEQGNFLVSQFQGQFVKDEAVQAAIIADLKNRQLLLRTAEYTHDYPFCWRCNTPLLYYAKDSWFIKMSALREKLQKANETINWVPEHIKDGRFGEWLDGVKDWAISRERYWGTPLPIWQCACGERKVIGSYQELADASGNQQVLDDDFDPHRPMIDELKIKCQCGQEMSRIKAVADCWFDSGAMPFAQSHYPFSQPELIDQGQNYPADFISEAMDQTRGWFYTLLAVATLLDKPAPFRNVICLGLINDEKGQKMSKSKGNVIDPWEVIKKFGADALRFHLYTINQPGDTKNFDPKNVEEVIKKNWLILFNVLNFYELSPATKIVLPANVEHVLDKWILALLSQLIKDVTTSLEKYDIFSASRALSDFINELSTWYIRRSRERFKSQDLAVSEPAKITLAWVLWNFNKLLAPFAPFLTEEIYRRLSGSLLSVHLETWPETSADFIDDKVLTKMAKARKIVELALAKRDETGFKVRQPLNKLTVFGPELEADYLAIILEEVNIKEIVFQPSEELKVALDTTLTPALREEGILRELVRQVNNLRKNAKLSMNDRVDLFCQTASSELQQTLQTIAPDLVQKTGCRNFSLGQPAAALESGEIVLEKDKVMIYLAK